MPRHILVIEDDALTARAITVTLQREGFEVTHFDNGTSAIEWAKDNKADVVLCDMQLPDSLGLDIHKALQNGTKLAATPLIFLTAVRSPDTVRQGIHGGAKLYLTKPVDDSELLDAIREVLA